MRRRDKMPARNKKNFRPTEKGAGMTKAGVAAYRRKNPGSKLQTAVTGKVKPGSKAAKRRKSYCARSLGQLKRASAKTRNDPNSRIRQARRRWKSQMSYLNANIPPIYCKVRKEYLYDLKEHHGESEECVIFGLTSISGRAILFNIMLPNGACFWRLPISAFFQKSYDRADVPDMQTHELELWNCFSYWPSVHRFDWLAGINGKFLGINKKFYHGNYLFTVDWAHPETNILDVEHSEIPQEHKCAHILALTNGNYAAQPNNRILWHVNSYTTDNSWPDYKVQTTYWDAEDSGLVTEDSDKMFYEMEKKVENKSLSEMLQEGFNKEHSND